jgi:Cytidylyltransferase-like
VVDPTPGRTAGTAGTGGTGRSGPSGRSGRSGIGAYPGSFDPPTVAHLAVAEAAREQAGLARIHLIVSRQPLGKAPTIPSLEDRVAVLEEMASTRPWLDVRVTDRRLIAEVADGYDAVVMGVDKWLQVIDESWYEGSAAARDRAVASLPRVIVAHRRLTGPGYLLPGSGLPEGGLVLDLDAEVEAVSSTAVRAGRVEWMAPEAARFDAATGAWSDPARYQAWSRSGPGTRV